jgi:hypothetical protein
MAEPAKGINSFVGTAPETVWGTPVGATLYNHFLRQSFVPDSDETEGDKSLGKAFESAVDVYRKRTPGDITFNMKFQGFERWLKNVCGACTTTALTGSDTGAYKHVFSVSATRPVGMSLELHLELFKSVIPGLILNRLDLEMGVGILKATFGGLGKAITSPQGSVASSPTYAEDTAGITHIKALESGSPGTPTNPNVGFSLGVGVAGTFASPSYICAQQPARINLTAPMKEDDLCLGDPGLMKPTLSDVFACSGGFPRQLIDDDFLEYALAQNPIYLRHRYDGPTPIVPGGSQHYAVHIDAPYARVKKALGPVENAAAIIEQVEWKASPPTGAAADFFLITLYNKLSSVT